MSLPPLNVDRPVELKMAQEFHQWAMSLPNPPEVGETLGAWHTFTWYKDTEREFCVTVMQGHYSVYTPDGETLARRELLPAIEMLQEFL